jgi:polyferredoxin
MNSMCEERAQTQESDESANKPPQRKKMIRRRSTDRSQQMRWWIQTLFLILNVWIGVEFMLFVRYYESGGTTALVGRPAGVEGWLPIGALMNLKYCFMTGQIPPVHPAAMFLLIAFLAISWIFRKSFCSWLCPIGMLSEVLWKLGKRLFGRNIDLHPRVDVPFRALKYILLGLFVYAVASMSPAAILAFMKSPYGLIADIKMFYFFRHLSLTAALVLGLLFLASVFVKNFWCRYLCPYGALMGLAALLSPTRIQRSPEACIDCAKCARVCPSLLPVDKLLTVRSPECTGCLECVAICPVEPALQLSVGKKRTLPSWTLATGILVLFLGIVGCAKWSGRWQSNIPPQIYFDLVPRAHELVHP